jgi:16S rRNA processing protein RimM
LSGAPETPRPWLQVARVLRPRGNKGEVVAELLTDFPERLSHRKEVYLRKETGEPKSVGLQLFWMDRNHPGTGVFHFAGCATISDAEKWRGFDVLLPMEERVALPAGKYFVTDLIGCTVFQVTTEETRLASPACAMEESPRVIGRVRDVFFPGESTAGTPLLQVETTQGELLVPLAEDICSRIDVAARRIEVKLPEGLDELNSAGR